MLTQNIQDSIFTQEHRSLCADKLRKRANAHHLTENKTGWYLPNLTISQHENLRRAKTNQTQRDQTRPDQTRQDKPCMHRSDCSQISADKTEGQGQGMVTRYHLGRPLDEPKFGGVGSVEIDQSFFRVFHEFRRRHVPFAVGGTCSTAHYFPSKRKSSFCSGPRQLQWTERKTDG